MPSALNIIGILFLLVSVVLFVRSYRKNNNDNLIFAIEFLILALMCPFMTYWYYPKHFGLSTNWIHLISHHALWGAVLVYYVIRIAYVVYKSYTKNNISPKLNKKKAKN